MSIRKIPFLIGEYYHLYNRGVDKRSIFLDKHDYKRFMILLYLCNSTKQLNIRNFFIHNKGKTFVDMFKVDRGETIVDIIVYCLMPNHFHILIREKTEGGASKFAQKLSTAYSMYFNSRYGRSGSLFEGKFKSKHIDSEPYFLWIFSYIHLNPLKLINSKWKEDFISNIIENEKFIRTYEYSSYYDYFVSDRLESVILSKNAAPEYVTQLDDFKSIISQFNVGF